MIFQCMKDYFDECLLIYDIFEIISLIIKMLTKCYFPLFPGHRALNSTTSMWARVYMTHGSWLVDTLRNACDILRCLWAWMLCLSETIKRQWPEKEPHIYWVRFIFSDSFYLVLFLFRPLSIGTTGGVDSLLVGYD